MRIMRNAYTLLVTTTLAATMVTGCSSEEETQEPANNENTASKASALTAPVQQAAANPSGSVDQGSIQGVFDAYGDVDLITLGGQLPGDLDLDGLQNASLDCVSGNSMAGSVDMACATGGEATGTLAYEIAVEAQRTYVYHSFDNLCIPAEDLCMNGEGAVETGADANGASTVVAGNLTLTQGGVTDELRYGVTVITDASGFREEIVLWHNGASYVVTTQAGAGGVSYSVTGANGNWSCDITGDSGSCFNGAESIDF